jgi:tetratricopeptide (TPR) repeat protein
VLENARLLLRLLYQPSAAMSGILDQGSLLFASVSVLVISLLLQTPWARAGVPFSFYTPLLILAMVFVPGVLLLAKLLAGIGGTFGAIFQRDYSSLLTCTAMSWTAANILLLLPSWILPGALWILMALPAGLYFMILMFFAVRTVFGTENREAAIVVCLSWVPLVGAAFLWGPLGFLLRWIASPFFLLFAWYYLGSEIGNLGAGLRRRQNFRRMLEAAAINPHDAEAQYQLGLIYQQRRQYTEAIQRFQNAVSIHPEETDAHFQLGRIAREQGRLKDALASFQTVAAQDAKHSQHEILRELGALYIAAKQFEDARQMLSQYVEHRAYDPEGLSYYGQSLEGLGQTEPARRAYEQSIEAARTAPRYRQGMLARWSRLAQKQLSRL